MEAAIMVLKEGRALRRLGIQETMWHELFSRRAGTSLLQYSLLLDSASRVEPAAVRTALTALQRQLPLLRTRVERIDGAHQLVAGPCSDVPLTVLPPGGDWLAEHHRQLREQTIDTVAGPLWKATLMSSPTNVAAPTAAPSHRAVLYLSLCHTITDGVSNGLICGQLLQNLDRVVRGRLPDVSAPAPVYPCVEQLLRSERVPVGPRAARELLRVLSVALSRGRHPLLEQFVAPFDPDLPPDSYWNQMVPFSLSAEESAALTAQCRHRGVSVNSVLSAAVSLAAARLLGGRCPALPTMWLVSVRRFLPPAAGLQLSAASGALGTVHVSLHIWPLAAQIGDMLNRQLQLKLPLLPLKLLGRFMTPERIAAGLEKSSPAAAGSAFVYNINNVGSLDGMLGQTEAVRLVELHRTFRAHPAMDGSFGSHCFHTVSGRLCYDLNFLRGRVREQDAQLFAESVLQILRETAESGRL